MAEFRQGVLTTQGTNLLAKAQAGEITIEFTTFQIGNGEWADDTSDATLMAMTKLKSAKNTFDISEAKYINSATTQLTLVASNISNTSAGYYITEVGVFARAKGTSSSILYAIYVTEEDKADWFPVYNSITPSSITYTCPISVANASEVTINANSGGIVTQDELQEAGADAHLAHALIFFKHIQDDYEYRLEVQTIDLEMNSNNPWPFNNAETTVALSQLRETAHYSVDISVDSYSGGLLGNIQVLDKALNGFKLLHDGSATSVTVTVRVEGGMTA